MSDLQSKKPLAKASVRRRLWADLGLGPNDGVSFREDGAVDGADVIVLCLRPSLVAQFAHVKEFEGFSVTVRATVTYNAIHSASNVG